MPKDDRNLLDVLKFELEFLDKVVTGDCRASPGGHDLFSRIPPLA